MPNKNSTLAAETEWNYSPAPQSSTEVKLRDRYEMFIDGKSCPGDTKDYIETINPPFDLFFRPTTPMITRLELCVCSKVPG